MFEGIHGSQMGVVCLPTGRVARNTDRPVTAIAQIVGQSVIWRRTVVRQNRRTVGTSVAVHMHGGIRGIGIAIHIIAVGTGVAGIADEGTVVSPIIWRNVGAIAAVVATYPSRLGGERGGENQDGEGEFGQNFHIFRYCCFC